MIVNRQSSFNAADFHKIHRSLARKKGGGMPCCSLKLCCIKGEFLQTLDKWDKFASVARLYYVTNTNTMWLGEPFKTVATLITAHREHQLPYGQLPDLLTL